MFSNLYKGYQEVRARRAQSSSASTRRSGDSSKQTSASTQATELSDDESFHRLGKGGSVLETTPSNKKRKASSDLESEEEFPNRKTRRRTKKIKSSSKYTGSPKDETERQILNVDDLDLDTSYVDVDTPMSMPKADKPRRWKHSGKEPLTDPKRLPKGWTNLEPDLDDEDIEAQIERCYERLEDNIMPHIFEQRLKEMEKRQADRLKITNKYPNGLSWNVIQRLEDLDAIKNHNEENGDKQNQLKNIKAIAKEYKAGRLDLTGLVTYWSKGKQLSQPRPFNWDELEAIQKRHGDSQGFWVEGLNMEQAERTFASIYARTVPEMFGLPTLYIAIRIPGRRFWVELRFIHDTGASNMMIYDQDVKELTAPIRGEHNSGAQPLIISQRTVYNASGSSNVHNMIEVEVTLLDRKGLRMCPWERIPAMVQDGPYIPNRSERLDGPWTRARFYTVNQPDGGLYTQIANDKSSLAIRRITQTEIKPLVYPRPILAAQPYDVGTPLGSVSPISTPERAKTPVKEQIAQKFHKSH